MYFTPLSILRVAKINKIHSINVQFWLLSSTQTKFDDIRLPSLPQALYGPPESNGTDVLPFLPAELTDYPAIRLPQVPVCQVLSDLVVM